MAEEANGTDQPPPPYITPMAVVFEGMLGVVAVGLGYILGYSPTEAIGWTAHAALLGAAASLPLVLLLWVCVRFSWWPFADLVRVVEQVVVPMFRRSTVLELGVISLVAGLGEEMLFRAVIQEAACQWAGMGIGLVLASVLFGLAHFLTFSYMLLATLMGCYLGWLWIHSGNLLVPITAHALYDFLALVYLVKIRTRRHGGP